MCGFVARFGRGADDRDAVRRATTAIAHRGPDGEGAAGGPGWALGFRRLRILDLSRLGDQPMATPDGRYQLVFNGEIYDYLELRTSLEARGCVFRSDGDTEVLLHALALDGPAALDRCNGMFALVFVDTVARTFLVARDRLGVKPVFYRPRAGGLDIASELKALLTLPDASRQVDAVAVAEYLALGYLSAETCVLEGYRKLPAGHLLRGSLDRPEAVTEHRWWHLEVSGDGPAWSTDELLDLLDDATRVRLRSDVPVGVFLSGGLDSGLVAAAATRVAPPDARPLALTVGFPDSPDLDESGPAAATARHLGLPHRIVDQRASALDDLDRLAVTMDEPFGDPSALATLALAGAAAEHGRVFLSGDGGDEAFAGYRRYVEAHRHARSAGALARLRGPTGAVLPLLPLTSRTRFRLRKATLVDQGYAAFFDAVADDPILPSILPPSLRTVGLDLGRPVRRRWRHSRGRPVVDRQRALDYDLYLPDDVLVKVDRTSMAHGVEVRSPMLDHRLVARAAQVPAASLMDAGGGKRPVRRLAELLLPAATARADKRGFGVPVDEWFAGDHGAAVLGERVLGREARARGLWDVDGVARLLAHHRQRGGRRFGTVLWRVLVLDAWSRHVLDPAPVEIPVPLGGAT